MDKRVENLLHEMENILTNARKIPLSDFVMVEKSQFIDLVHTIHENLPSEIKQAGIIIANETQIISEAKTQAKQTIKEANDLAKNNVEEAKQNAQILSQNAQIKAEEIYKNSVAQANQLLDEAKKHAGDIVNQAQIHADELVEQEEITARAKIESEELIQATNTKLRELHQKMYDYLDSMLDETDRLLSEKIEDIRISRQDLRNQQP